MSIDCIASPPAAAHLPKLGDRRSVATLEHRTEHAITRADCRDCLPAPCVCGRVLCPDAAEHRLEVWSSETAWREVSRG